MSDELKDFEEWFYGSGHRKKYSPDTPAYLAAKEAWDYRQTDVDYAEAEIARQTKWKEEWKAEAATNQGLLAAVAGLVKAKGRYHTEQNYKVLAEAFDALYREPK